MRLRALTKVRKFTSIKDGLKRDLNKDRLKKFLRQRYKVLEDLPKTLKPKNNLAVLFKEQVRYEEAEKYLLEAIEGRRLKLGDTHPHTLESIKSLITLYEAWNKPEKVNECRAKLPQTEAVDE